MAGVLDKLVAPGRHTRRPERAGLRRVCLAALIMLVVQYGLGIFLNLYVAVPASDAHAGIFQEIAAAPLALTVHALLGLALIGTAVLLLVRAVGVGDRLLAVLAATGLTAIGGAFGAGEIFVKNGQPTASLAMGVLTGAALLCYVGMLALASAARRQATGPERQAPLLIRPPRPRNPMTPPAPWPATPTRGFPARESWPAGESWPARQGWPAEESWAAAEEGWAEEDWANEDWADEPPARSPGSWFARD
jgi:hypothetical protein